MNRDISTNFSELHNMKNSAVYVSYTKEPYISPFIQKCILSTTRQTYCFAYETFSVGKKKRRSNSYLAFTQYPLLLIPLTPKGVWACVAEKDKRVFDIFDVRSRGSFGSAKRRGFTNRNTGKGKFFIYVGGTNKPLLLSNSKELICRPLTSIHDPMISFLFYLRTGRMQIYLNSCKAWKGVGGRSIRGMEYKGFNHEIEKFSQDNFRDTLQDKNFKISNKSNKKKFSSFSKFISTLSLTSNFFLLKKYSTILSYPLVKKKVFSFPQLRKPFRLLRTTEGAALAVSTKQIEGYPPKGFDIFDLLRTRSREETHHLHSYASPLLHIPKGICMVSTRSNPLPLKGYGAYPLELAYTPISYFRSISPKGVCGMKGKKMKSIVKGMHTNDRKYVIKEKAISTFRNAKEISSSMIPLLFESDLVTFITDSFNSDIPYYCNTVFPGQLIAYGDTIANNIVTTESGQVLYIDSQKTTLRKAQTVLIYSQAIIAVLSGEWIKKGTPLMSLSYQKLVTGDIVQGLPKIEQFFEAPVLRDGTFWSDSLQAKLNQFFQEEKEKLPLAEAVRKSFSEIQRVLVEGVQRVYISQGVLIADKHLEVIVRQMTCKGRILYSGDTGFLRNELVSLDKIENVNQVTYGQKALYHPQVRGITDASLESESFLSAASFQETTRVLSRDAIIGKTDLMRGLKERVIVGELVQAGTGLANNSVYSLL